MSHKKYRRSDDPDATAKSPKQGPEKLQLVGGLSNFLHLPPAPTPTFGAADALCSGQVVPLTTTAQEEIHLLRDNRPTITASLYVWGHPGSDGLPAHALLAFLLPN